MLNCPVCQEGIKENPKDNNYPWVLLCGHVYHKQCIEQSLKIKKECPQCRHQVTTSFRLYPNTMTTGDTITFLQDCTQSAEQQYERQKKICQEKDTFIRGLESTLATAESENTELRRINVTFAKTALSQTNKLNADIKKLQEEKTLFNEELKKSVKKVARHESTITSLQVKIRALEAAIVAKMDTETKLNQEIDKLKGALDQVQRTQWAYNRAKVEEINKLQARVKELQAQVVTANKQIEELSEREELPRARQADPAVDDLMHTFERIALPSALPSLRKRKNIDENSYGLSGKEMKQLRSDASAEGLRVAVSSEPDAPNTEASGESAPVKTKEKKFAVRKILKVVKFDKKRTSGSDAQATSGEE